MGNVADALKRLMEATDILRKAEAKCEYDRSYFLHLEYCAVDSAEEEFIAAIREELKEPSE
jgi:hypothetical protein